MSDLYLQSGAEFSPCRLYRYSLWRLWDDRPKVAFIGLNPSTADETADDPTIRRCIGYASDWGYGGLYMLNLFAFRATDPKDMKAASDPVGPDNNLALTGHALTCAKTIAAWGNDGLYRARSAAVRAMLPRLYCLGLNANGEPKHPLYLAKNLRPVLWVSLTEPVEHVRE